MPALLIGLQYCAIIWAGSNNSLLKMGLLYKKEQLEAYAKLGLIHIHFLRHWVLWK